MAEENISSEIPNEIVEDIVKEEKEKEEKTNTKKTSKKLKKDKKVETPQSIMKKKMEKKRKDRRDNLFKANEILQGKKNTQDALIMRPQNPFLKIRKINLVNRYRINKLLQGGPPVGKMTLLWGDEGTGKTTTALIITASAQRTCRYCNIPFPLDFTKNRHGDIKKCKCGNDKGYSIAWLDTECAFDPEYARRFGVITDEMKSDLFIIQPETAEKAEDVLEVLIQQGIDLVVIDSVANLSPKSDITRNSEENRVVAGRANIVNSMITKILNTMRNVEFPPTTIMVNQSRLEIKTGFSMAPPQKYPPGGMFQKFACALSICFHKPQQSKKKFDDSTGELLRKDMVIQIVKSKVCRETDRVLIPIHLGTPGVEWGYMEENMALFSEIKPYISGSAGKYSILGKEFRTYSDIQDYLYSIEGQKIAEKFIETMK